jgi:hypothetical protein
MFCRLALSESFCLPSKELPVSGISTLTSFPRLQISEQYNCDHDCDASSVTGLIAKLRQNELCKIGPAPHLGPPAVTRTQFAAARQRNMRFSNATSR